MVKTEIICKMSNTLFFNVWAPNIYSTSSTFLKVILKVLFFNISQRISTPYAAVDLIDLFVGTYRLSSHARLEPL
jgi:hypothetical protein